MTATASFFDFQLPLPGIPPAARSDGRLSLVPHPDLAGTTPTPGQFSLGDEQIQLQPIEPSPVQLGMLPEPPVWELPDPDGINKVKGTSSRRTDRPAGIPGQVALF